MTVVLASLVACLGILVVALRDPLLYRMDKVFILIATLLISAISLVVVFINGEAP